MLQGFPRFCIHTYCHCLISFRASITSDFRSRVFSSSAALCSIRSHESLYEVRTLSGMVTSRGGKTCGGSSNTLLSFLTHCPNQNVHSPCPSSFGLGFAT